jgi:hypothetical protein
MATTTEGAGRTDIAGRREPDRLRVRRSTETKASFKTTEFLAYLGMLAGVFIAGAVAKATGYGGHHDIFQSNRVWLYAVILTVGYMISRGLAKSGSRDPYTDEV